MERLSDSVVSTSGGLLGLVKQDAKGELALFGGSCMLRPTHSTLFGGFQMWRHTHFTRFGGVGMLTGMLTSPVLGVLDRNVETNPLP